MNHTVTAHRRKKWWIIQAFVDGSEIRIRCKRLDQATALARRAIARALHVDESSLRVELLIDVPKELQAQIDRTRVALAQAAEARAHAALLGHGTAALLSKKGLGRRDIALLMGVSPGKAARLLGKYKGESTR